MMTVRKRRDAGVARPVPARGLQPPNHMRWTIAAGLVALAVRTASAGFVVELADGDRMTVDNYWTDGDKAHLQREGGDLIIPRARIRSVSAVDTPSAAHADSRSASPKANASSREELEAREVGESRHMLRIQQERFEAEARGESPEHLKSLDSQFRRARQRRADALRALDQLQPPK